MILIAPDKYKGTLSARQAASIIADALKDFYCVRAPMADGGEGTAAALCHGPHWEQRDCYYVNRHTRTAVIDSSAVIGITPASKRDILRASSAPLGIKVREIIKYGCEKVVIGIGGTGCCDGGLGFLEGLGLDKYHTYRERLVGLADVEVPLLPPDDVPDEKVLEYPSALMFAPQKGASALDLSILRRRLEEVERHYGMGRHSAIDGAGGGLGFAIASAIDASWHKGAEYVLGHYDIDWNQVELIITGEGRIDQQTARGKVVHALSQRAQQYGIPCVAIGGTVAQDLDATELPYYVVSTEDYYPGLPLDADSAAMRLRAAAENIGVMLKHHDLVFSL